MIKEINKPKKGLNKDSSKIGNIKGKGNTAIKEAFITPQEEIENIDGINSIKNLIPIQSGKVRFFNPTKQIGFISPDNGGKDFYIEKYTKIGKKTVELFKRDLKDNEHVNFIELNKAAMLTESGEIHEGIWRYFNKMKGEGFISQNGGKRDIYVNRLGGNFNDGDKVKYLEINDEAIPLELKDDNFKEGDKVNFITNKKGIIVAIQKI